MGQKQIKNVESKQLRSILMTDDWTLNNGRYRILQCKKFFTQSTNTPKIKRLDFKANNEPNIPQDIMHIHFSSSLIFMDLSGNAILSLEKLSFLDMKNLQVLVVEWNYIMSLGSFRKNSFKNLLQLKLSNNYIVDFGNYERAYNRKLKEMVLEIPDQIFIVRETIPDAISKVAKMESMNLYLLGLGATKRIDQSKSLIYKSVKRKFAHHLYLTKAK